MKIGLTFLLFVLQFSVSYSQAEDFIYENEFIKVTCSKNAGQWNGKYVSYYSSGIKRAEGNYKNNNRVGIWTVYDSLGRKIVQRNYENSYIYKKLFPEKSKTGAASLFDTCFYSLIKNERGFIEYAKLEERMVIVESRLWRYISKKENPILFKNNVLFNCIYNHLMDKDTSEKSFCSSDEQFVKQLKKEEIEKFSLANYTIIGYKIKEDNFYENERCLSETRIVGICPIGISKTSKDTVEMFWTYLPYLRVDLAKVKIKGKNLSEQVVTLDDLFFFRNFNAEILKVANYQDKSLNDYFKSDQEIKDEQKRLEVDLIEREHEIWLGNHPFLN